jgi:methylglutaconyl-CoA hydratase
VSESPSIPAAGAGIGTRATPVVLVTTDPRGIARVTLNRPERHNALDARSISELHRRLERLGADPAVRIVVLQGAGASFCAGADLDYMKSLAEADEHRNFAEALALAQLLETLATLPKPTVAKVNGNAFGGGVGLIACCDVAVGAESTRFALTEVRLGLVPATISPYVVAAIGERASRRLFLTGERLDASQARACGLLHECVRAEELDAAVERVCDDLLRGGPQAQREAKELLREVARGGEGEDLQRSTSARLARLRVSHEAQEGMSAFLEKRAPKWP